MSEGTVEAALRAALDYFEGYDRTRTDGRSSPIISQLQEALAALRSRGSSEPEEVAARERSAFNGCDAHGKPWPCDGCGEGRERGSSDTRLIAIEQAAREFLDLNYGYLDYKVKDALQPLIDALAAARADAPQEPS